MTELDQYEEIARQLYDGSIGKAVERLPDVTADDAVLHDPLEGTIRGREGVTDYYRDIDEGFSDGRITADDVVADGEKVTIRWTFSGTHDGEILGIEPTGEVITFSGIDVLRFEDGTIGECWSHYDSLGLMEQFGVVATEDVPTEER